MNELVLHRPQRCGGARRDPDLRVDVLDVVIGGLRRDVELLGDRLRRETSGREVKDLDLAIAESRRMLTPRFRRRVASEACESIVVHFCQLFER